MWDVVGNYNIKEGKGRLKSWTLCDRLSEGVMGQGLAAPARPHPPAHPWCRGATQGHNIKEGDPHGSRAPVVTCVGCSGWHPYVGSFLQ